MKVWMTIGLAALALPIAAQAQAPGGGGGPGGPGGFNPAAMFDRFDTDKDGKVTKAEYDAVRAANPRPGGGGGGGAGGPGGGGGGGGGAGGPGGGAPRMSWFDRMDANKDGTVTKAEADAGMAAMAPPQQ